MAVEVARHRFTVDEYYRMAEAGILGEDDRVELIEGEIVEIPPIGSYHASVVDRLMSILAQRLDGERSILRVQNPVRLSARSEPQPDLTILRYRADFFRDAHPGPQDVLLLIEVVDTSGDYDRQVKLPLYAGAGILEVWLVDLPSQTIEVCRDSSRGGYRSRESFSASQRLSPAALPGLSITPDEILG